ncbi:hypothetical protein SIAM614_02271 [Stappia aggregata IAM 12614]|uniref:Uncharacterized protein n=1 Tax=Roseibium aggregatum (strain ATCC 25650 / DSM 13394 / JCM 20685 / NBRC 16684 / NCIMB 2208 / IAM 12614 / B1) TaxID=384765 RepID=A0NU63_ROSAI|nr:hypothetical protein SIAM614_02271 [Stappia aggregata IAM 12614] [Roseibium aggregatum IAM 12614]
MHDQQRTFVPFGVRNGNHRTIRNTRMRHDDVFQIKRADPLTTRFDEVLGPVRDRQKSVRADGGDVAGAEPAFLVEDRFRSFRVLIIAGSDRVAADIEMARCLAVVRQAIAGIIDDLHVDAKDPPPLALFPVDALVERQIRHRRRQIALRAERAHFRHAPGMADVDALLLEPLDQRARGCRAADDDIAEAIGKAAALADLVHEADPDGRNAPGGEHLFAVHQVEQAFAVQRAAWENQTGAGKRCAIGQAPGVDVKQRHNGQNARSFLEDLWNGDAHVVGMQHRGAVRIERALGVACRTGGVTKAGGLVLVKIRPVHFIRLPVKDLLVTEHAIQRRFRHMRAVRHDDHAKVCRKMRAQLFHDRQEGEINEQQPVLGVIDDIDHLFRRKTRIDGVADGADAGNCIVELEMAIAIPGKCRDAVALADTERLQAMAQPGDAAGGFLVGCAVNIAFRPHGNDLAGRISIRCKGDEVRDFQRTVHHHSLHVFPPRTLPLHTVPQGLVPGA